MKKNVLREKRASDFQKMLRAKAVKKIGEILEAPTTMKEHIEVIEKPKRVKKNVNNSK